MLQRLRRWLTGRQSTQTFPTIVTVTDLTTTPLTFRIYSRVEKRRTKHYGGERANITEFLRHLRPDDTVFDIGASVGLYSVASAVTVTSGAVYSFEPDPELRQRLIDNASLTGVLNVHAVDWAVSSGAGTVDLFTDGANGLSPSLARQTERENAPRHSIKVRTESIDRAIESGQLPLPSVLKIDIEGAELLALQGAQKLLRGDLGIPPRVVFLEVHPSFLPYFGASAADIEEIWSGLTRYHLVYEDKRTLVENRLYLRE